MFCARQKDDLHSIELVFEEALNAVKFLCWLKKFGPAQKILGPVKGQGINYKCFDTTCLDTEQQGIWQ